MAVGFGDDDNHLETIQATLDDGIAYARMQLGKGESLTNCLECREPIPAARRKALSGVKYCVGCQEQRDSKVGSGYNRRGSKDSQLR